MASSGGHGSVGRDESGAPKTWRSHLDNFVVGACAGGATHGHPRLPATVGGRGCDEQITEAIGVSPLDEHNATLLDNVHPVEWKDPDRGPDFVYDLIALGAGAGGLVSAKQSARRGAKSALIEMHLAGGDCLNIGCVPSKALLRCARAARERRRGAEFGLPESTAPMKKFGLSETDFGAVMERMRRLRAKIAPADSHEATVAAGADVYQGRGVFVGHDTIAVNGKLLRFKKAVVATGGSAAVPPIPGLADAPFHTNASIFNLTAKPQRICVIGGGPIGLELAQAFACFGIAVTVLLRGDVVLPKEDADAATIVRESLEADGVVFERGLTFDRVDCVRGVGGFAKGASYPEVSVRCTRNGEAKTFACEILLVATGRKPNVHGIGLEAAGVTFDARAGVHVDDELRTSNPAIYAVGDVCTAFQFTHVAGTMAGVAVQNALFGGAVKFSSLLIPWCTYTEPEIAHVGLYERDFADRGIECDTYTTSLAHNDRAILESSEEGFVKIHCLKGTDEILGATIVSDHAGETISELTLAIGAKVGLGAIGKTIHPYPTVAEAIQGCGIAFNRTRWAKMGDAPHGLLVEKAKPFLLAAAALLTVSLLARRR